MLDENHKETHVSKDWVMASTSAGVKKSKDRKKAALRTAATLLVDGFSPARVEKYTGLSHDELAESGLIE